MEKPPVTKTRTVGSNGSDGRSSPNKLKTFGGFPIEGDSDIDGDRVKGRGGERGIALMIAIMIVAIVMGFMSDMIISSSVNVELALGHRDRVKAEYMAKSGGNLALFLATVDWGMDLFMADKMKKTPADGPGDVWSALNGLPIGGATLEMMAGMQEQFDLSSVMDSGVLDQMKLLDGQFILNVSDESSRINVNFCHKGRCTHVLKMLEALMSCPTEKAFLDEKTLDPKEMAFRIKDYIDSDKRAAGESGFSDEDQPYQEKDPRYRAKNAPLESVEELKMIAGWDDDMHAVFAPYLTVYPYQESGRDVAKININTASQAMLSCLIPDSVSEDCRENFLVKMADKGKEKANFAEGSNVQSPLKDLTCYVTGKDSSQSSDDKSKWFVGTSRVLRLEVDAGVGNQTRKLLMVIRRLDSQQMKKLKVDKSYEILHWKLI